MNFKLTIKPLVFLLIICVGAILACDMTMPTTPTTPTIPTGPDTTNCGPMQSARPVNFDDIGSPPSGPYDVSIEQAPDFNTHTIYRPEVSDAKMPIVVFGNGGCVKNGLMFGEFLNEIASHGIFIIADGRPNGSGMDASSLTSPNGEALEAALDWAFTVNDDPCSAYYQTLDTTKVAAMGQSCGGLMAFGVSGDPRITTLVIWNSGMFKNNDRQAYQRIISELHAPMAFFIGGRNDVAFTQAEDNFAAINNVPVFYGNLNVGHMGTYSRDNGGEFGRVGTAWLKWQLLGDTSASGEGMFVGSNCGLCNSQWQVRKKNME